MKKEMDNIEEEEDAFDKSKNLEEKEGDSKNSKKPLKNT